MRYSFLSASAILFSVALLTPGLPSQVPEGWYAVSSFQFCAWSPPGRIVLVNPRTAEVVEVQGLPADLVALPCLDEAQGAGSIAVRAGDGAIVAGEITGNGQSLDIYFLELDGFNVIKDERYPVGDVIWNTGEIMQMQFLPDGRVLFAFYGVTGGEVSQSGLGILDLSKSPANEAAVNILPVGLTLVSINALAVEPKSEMVYLSKWGGFTRSDIYSAELEAVLDGLETGDPSVVDYDLVGTLPLGVTQLAVTLSGDIVVAGFGTGGNLFIQPSASATFEQSCPDVTELDNDINALAVDPVTGEFYTHFGGPVNSGGPLNDKLVTIRPAGCEIGATIPHSVFAQGIPSGISVRPRSPETPPIFVRGNANGHGDIDLSDAVSIFNFLFLGGMEPGCLDSADTDDNGKLELTDGIYLLNYLFLGGEEPAAPFADCGADPTDDELICDAFSPCE